jgi:hypothetical protein
VLDSFISLESIILGRKSQSRATNGRGDRVHSTPVDPLRAPFCVNNSTLLTVQTGTRVGRPGKAAQKSYPTTPERSFVMAVGKKIGFLATTLLMGSLTVSAFGQAQPGANPPPPDNGGQNGRPGRGQFDPAQRRQRMIQGMKDQLGASDEEMAALSPKIEKVMQLQRDARGGGGFGRRGGGPGGPGGPGGTGGAPGGAPTDANASPVQKASADLRSTLDNKDAKPDDIKAKLDALRAARTQAKQDLTAAQQELKGLLTQRQEAVMVEMGMLD